MGVGERTCFDQGTSTSCFAKCLLYRLPSPPSPKTVRQTTINSTSCLVVRVLLFLCQRGCVRVWRGGYAGCCGHPPAGLCQLASTAGASDQQQRRHSRRWCSPGPSSASSHRCPARSSPVCGGQVDLGLTACRSCGPVVLSPRLPAWRALCQDTRRPCCCSHAYVSPLRHWLPPVLPRRCLLPHVYFLSLSLLSSTAELTSPLWLGDSPLSTFDFPARVDANRSYTHRPHAHGASAGLCWCCMHSRVRKYAACHAHVHTQPRWIPCLC